MTNKTYITKSAEQTRKIGEKMAREILVATPNNIVSSQEKSISPTTTLNGGERWGRGFSAPPHLWNRCGGAQKNGAIVLAMEGDLGGGKTTFIQGFAKGLGIKENITSPTFVILKKFEIAASHPVAVIARSATARRSNLVNSEKGRDCRARPVGLAGNDRSNVFYHIDCYRIEKPKDLLDLGIENILLDSHNIVAIEWSEKIQKILPKNAVKIKFEFVDDTTRKISITNH